jgi:hypothetical protein
LTVEEYFLNYNGEKIFVVLLGFASNKYYFYYPKGDTLVIIDSEGKVEMKEILEVVGTAPAGFKVGEVVEPWEKVKARPVVWRVLDKEIQADNIYAVYSTFQDYKILESSVPDRLKSFFLRDQDPWEYKDWCCVMIASQKDLTNLPPTFKKIYLKNGKLEI